MTGAIIWNFVRKHWGGMLIALLVLSTWGYKARSTHWKQEAERTQALLDSYQEQCEASKSALAAELARKSEEIEKLKQDMQANKAKLTQAGRNVRALRSARDDAVVRLSDFEQYTPPCNENEWVVDEWNAMMAKLNGPYHE